MKIDFSKPLGDVAEENHGHFKNNAALLERQRRISACLNNCENRFTCIVCERSLINTASFNHRSVDYIICPLCGHIQSKVQLPDDYPNRIEDEEGLTFNDIYPKLSQDKYELRKKRIYHPKLNWALDCHKELGLSRGGMINSAWLDLGCGAGYFLSALDDIGAKKTQGIEANLSLVNIANEMLDKPVVRHFSRPLTHAVKECPADIYTAFFVLEHIEDTKRFFKEMGKHRTGTVFLFSVPTFGFGVVLESAFDHHFARNLDSVIHTQLYTDSSIQYCLELAGYEMVAQWIFGQDASDLLRMVMESVKIKYPEPLYNKLFEQYSILQDPIQNIIDQHYLADSRHVLAIKR